MYLRTHHFMYTLRRNNCSLHFVSFRTPYICAWFSWSCAACGFKCPNRNLITDSVSFRDRRSPKHGFYDRREVLVGNDGLCEEPDTDERSAGPAARPGHRPASPRSPRRQRAAVLFIGGSIHTKHTYASTRIHTHTHTQRLWSDVTHTHTADSHRETSTHRAWCKLGALLLPKNKQTEKQDDTTGYVSLCAVKPKNKREKFKRY